MDVKIVLGALGNVIAIILFASPLPTFLNIYKKKSVQDFSAVPYLCTLLNCSFWVLYGLPFITEGELLLLTVNAAGSVFQIYFLMIYLTYASPEPRRKAMKLLAACTLAFAVVVLLTFTAVPKKARTAEVGLVCAVFNVCMYTSPLSIMRMVIRTRSVQFMPFFLSLFQFLTGASWASYGIYTKDFFVAIPNGLGTVAGTAQLILYAIYRNANDKSKAFDQKGDAANDKDAANEGPVKQQTDDHVSIPINEIVDVSVKSSGTPPNHQKRDDATPLQGPVKEQTDHHVSIPINKIEDASVKSNGSSPNRQKRDDATRKETANKSPVTQRTDHHISIPIEKKVGEKTTETTVSEQQ